MCTPVHLKSYDTHGTDWLISQCWPLCWEDMSDTEFLFKARIGNSFHKLLLLLALLGVKPGASHTLHQRSGHEDTLPALPFSNFSLTLCAFTPLVPFKPFILFFSITNFILLLLMQSPAWFSISPSSLISYTVLLFLSVSFKMFVRMHACTNICVCLCVWSHVCPDQFVLIVQVRFCEALDPIGYHHPSRWHLCLPFSL